MGEKSKKYSRTAKQEICIYYRDIGLMGKSGEHSETQVGETEESNFGAENKAADDRAHTAATDTDPAA